MKPVEERPYRFGVLLAALLALFIGTGLLDYTRGFLHPRILYAAAGLLLILVLMAAVVNVSGGRRSRPARMARFLIALTILVQVVSVTLDSRELGIAARGLATLCIGYIILVVIRFLIGAQKVDTETIRASICVYLLMCHCWALWYSVLFFLEPGSFAEGHGLATFGQRGLSGELYYSLVTLTTLGYGDVVPLTTAARMSAALEAAVGQIYVVILVARLVGLSISQPPPEA